MDLDPRHDEAGFRLSTKPPAEPSDPTLRAARRQPRRFSHPKPHPECWICRQDFRDPAVVALFEPFRLVDGPQLSARRRRLLDEVITGHRLPITVEQAETHNKAHYAPQQPWPSSEAIRDQLQETHTWLDREPRRWRVLERVAQSKGIAAQHVGELFFGECTTANDSRRRQARTLLRAMVHRHLVQRTWVTSSVSDAPRSVYFLGRMGAEMLSRTGPHEGWDPDALRTISPAVIDHNLGVETCMVGLWRSQGPAKVLGRDALISVELENYWATKILSTVRIPAYRDETKTRRAARTVRVIPDALFTAGVQDLSDAEGASHLLPAVLEFDSGSRSYSETSEQIFAHYHRAGSKGLIARAIRENHPEALDLSEAELDLLAERARLDRLSASVPAELARETDAIVLRHFAGGDAAGAALLLETLFADFARLARPDAITQPFPELDVPGFRAPTIFASRYRPDASGDRRRVLAIRRHARELFSERGMPVHFDSPPIYVALLEDLRELGLRAPALSLWSASDDFDAAPSLIEVLVSANRPLREAGTLDAGARLLLDPGGATREKRLSASEMQQANGAQRRIGITKTEKARQLADREAAEIDYEREKAAYLAATEGSR